MTLLKRALVTGGTRGIGFEITKMLLNKNYEVVFTGRTQETVNKALERYNNPNVQGVVLDMTNLSNINNKDYYTFDTVIHNAGMLSRDNMQNMSENKLEKMFKVNIISPMYITKHCLPYMLKQKTGNIFFFCPPYKIDAKTRFLTPYMQTKLAQTTFMYSIADMVAKRELKTGTFGKIKVSGFWTDYPIYTDALIHRNIGIRENCMSPEIIAKTVELMLDDDQSNIQGDVIVDRYYLTKKGYHPNKWALGNQLWKLDDLFLKNIK